MTTLRFNGNTANQRGITHWGKNDVGRWYLVQDFTGDRGRACGDERIGGIIEKIMAMLARESCGAFGGSSLTHRAPLHHFCPEGDNSRALYRVRIFRKKNRGADLRDTRGIGNRGTVLTSTSRHTSWQCALRHGCEQSIERTPQLERSSRQIGFNL